MSSEKTRYSDSELEEFRTKTLGLPAKSLSEKQLESEKIPLLLGYSPTILELPEDIQSWHIGVGFWFLTDDEEEETEYPDYPVDDEGDFAFGFKKPPSGGGGGGGGGDGGDTGSNRSSGSRRGRRAIWRAAH